MLLWTSNLLLDMYIQRFLIQNWKGFLALYQKLCTSYCVLLNLLSPWVYLLWNYGALWYIGYAVAVIFDMKWLLLALNKKDWGFTVLYYRPLRKRGEEFSGFSLGLLPEVFPEVTWFCIHKMIVCNIEAE